MKRFVLVLVSIIMSVVLASCQSIEKEERMEVTATITEMQYEDSMVFFNPALKMSQILTEKYWVTITFEDISETLDDQTLYESVKEGDTIQMILYKAYDENGNLIKQRLYLPE